MFWQMLLPSSELFPSTMATSSGEQKTYWGRQGSSCCQNVNSL